MKLNIVLDESLLKKALEMTGIKDKSAVISRGLELLIQEEATKQLVALGGVDPGATISPKRRR